MMTIDTIKDFLRQMPFDIRLEVLLAELTKEDINMDNIVVMNNSLFKRNYHQDIETAGEIEYEPSRKKKLYFVVNRDGIYDHAPQDLFHQPPDLAQNAGREDVIREMKTQEQVEKDTRLFFLPIEQELYRQRVNLALEEADFLSVTGAGGQDHFLRDLWDLPTFLDDASKGKLSLLMPVLHKFAGNIQLIPVLIQFITGYRAEAFESPPRIHVLPATAELGIERLGIDLLLGGHTANLQSSITISVFLQDNDRLTEFMPDGKMEKMFAFVAGLIISYEKDIVFEWTMPDKTFVISAEKRPDAGRLNYTTVI